MTLSPAGSESYTVTIIKNDSETILSCIIIGDNTSCENSEFEIPVNAGDTIILKVEASSLANSAIIRSSVLYYSS